MVEWIGLRAIVRVSAQVNKSIFTAQWKVGHFSWTTTSTCYSGRAYVYEDSTKELALCVGSGERKTRLHSKTCNCADSCPVRFTFYYNGGVGSNLVNPEICAWDQVLSNIASDLRSAEVLSCRDSWRIARILLDEHERSFADSLQHALGYEYDRSMDWKYLIERSSGAQVGKGVDDVRAIEMESELEDLKSTEISLRKQIKQYRLHLGSLSSSLRSSSLHKDVRFPSAWQVLHDYRRVSSTVLTMYERIVVGKVGVVDEALQERFAVNLSVVLDGMWDEMRKRHLAVVRDRNGLLDVENLPTSALHESDMHCQEHWAYHFLPVVNSVLAVSGQISFSLAPENKKSQSTDNIHSELLVTHFMGEEELYKLEIDDQVSDLQYSDDIVSVPSCSSPVIPSIPVPSRFLTSVKWFLEKDPSARKTLTRLWKVVVLLFLQQPLMRFQSLPNPSIEHDRLNFGYVGRELRDGQAVMVVVPPIICAPTSASALRLTFDDIEDWVIVEQGLVDLIPNSQDDCQVHHNK